MTATQEISSKLILKKRTRTYSLKEFLRKERISDEKHEFFNGKIIKMPYAKGPHNIISMNVAIEMSNQTEKTGKNYIFYGSDQMIYFPELNVGVYADALAVCDKPDYWDDEELLLINPIVVVEVLSKSTQKYDKTSKFEKYKTLQSLKEYVLIRQDEYYAEVWYREKPGLWHESIIKELDGILQLQSLGIDVSLKRIYKNITI